MAATETPTITTALDIAHMDTAALQALQKRIETTIKRRKTSLSMLTPADQTRVRRASRAFHIPASELAARMAELRDAPQHETIPTKDGTNLVVVPILDVAKVKTMRWALTGDGVLRKGRANGWRDSGGWDNIAVGEYTWPAPVGTVMADSRNIVLFHGALLRTMRALPTPLPPRIMQIILDAGGDHDSPQEAVMTWVVAQTMERLHAYIEGIGLAVIRGTPPPPPTVRSLIAPVLQERPESGWSENHMRYSRHMADWVSEVARALEAYLTQQNLLATDLAENPALDIGFPDILARWETEKKLCETRAGSLRAAVVARYGWRPCIVTKRGQSRDDRENGWVKCPPNTVVWQVHGRETPLVDLASTEVRGTPNAVVTETCKVYIQGSYRCIVEGVSTYLPQADQVARRMLALATTHREEIHTLASDLVMLAALFEDVSPMSIEDLRSLEANGTPSPSLRARLVRPRVDGAQKGTAV